MNDFIGRIYVVTNLINGKCYVGQTRNSILRRWSQHAVPCNATRRQHGIFSKVISKYGKENFFIQEVSVAGTKESLDNLEKVWIMLLQSSVPQFGYNRTAGGDGSHTEEVLKIMRRPKPPSYRERLLGKARPPHIQKILAASNAAKFKLTPEMIGKIISLREQNIPRKKISKILSLGDGTVNRALVNIVAEERKNGKLKWRAKACLSQS